MSFLTLVLIAISLVLVKSRCINSVHSFNLSRHLSTDYSITISNSESWTLFCVGEEFVNKSWTILNGSALTLTASAAGDAIVLKTDCYKTLNRCEVISLKCSGQRNATGDRLDIHLNLYPDCLQKSHQRSIKSAEVTSAGCEEALDRGISVENNEEPDFFGLIVGFVVCTILALLSCLIVFVHKKCSDSQLNNLFCVTSHGAKSQSHKDPLESSQRPNLLLRGGNVALAKLNKRGTVHEL